MIPQELFNRFLKNECTDEEKEQVLNYLLENPGELDNHLPQEEFIQIDTHGQTGQELHDRLFQNVKAAAFQGKLRRLYIKRAIAVAAVLVVLVTGYWFIRTSTGNNNIETPVAKAGSTTPMPNWERINATATPVQVILPDSSVILLSANSKISYDGVFGANDQRAVHLTGEAKFDVRKDASRPFTVYSGNISTTALGTSFNIEAYDEANIITVHLITGKVVVKTADTLVRRLKENMFLVPGETLFYNKSTWQASIRKPENGQATAGKKRDILMPMQKPAWYMFDNQPVAEVLDQLSYYYGIRIVYRSQDLNNKYLTAKFQATDSLSKILKDIALLNQLSIAQTSDSFTVTDRAN